ncbi:MAG: hypothetical protein ABI165_20900 [Bryobacteraceae bacterium]
MFVGIELGPDYSRYSILGEDGDLLEHGSVRTTEAGLRGRFAAMPPSLMAVAFDGRTAWALDLLAGMGHSLSIAGELARNLRPALTPLVELLARQTAACGAVMAPGETRTVVFRQSGETGDAGLIFLVTVEDLLGRPAVSDVWYFVGPVEKGMRMAELSSVGSGAGNKDGQCPAERALRLHQLWEMGEIALPSSTRIAAA